jgi:hypothetical protein
MLFVSKITPIFCPLDFQGKETCLSSIFPLAPVSWEGFFISR